MCYNKVMKKRALSLVGAIIVSFASASSATAEGLPVIEAEGGTSVMLALEYREDFVRFDLTVSPDDQSLIEEYCTPSSSALEVVYGDATSSTASTGDASVEIGSSGPRLFVETVWVSSSLAEGEVVELRPEVLLTCTRMAPGNLSDGFVQVKISPRLVGFVPMYADLDPVDEASWTADTRLYQGLQPCLTAGSSLVDVFGASLMFDNGRYYNPVSIVRDLGNNNAPVVELAIDDAMRALGSFEVRAICVTNQMAYEYSTVADLSAVTEATGDVVVEKSLPDSATLSMVPCPSGSDVSVKYPNIDQFDPPMTHEVVVGAIPNRVVVVLEGAISSGQVLVPVAIRCETATDLVVGRTDIVFSAPDEGTSGSGGGSGSDGQPTEEDIAEAQAYYDLLYQLPVVGSVTANPSVVGSGEPVTFSPSAPCPGSTPGSTQVVIMPARSVLSDFLAGAISEDVFTGSEGGYPVDASGMWSISEAFNTAGLLTADAYNLPLVFICGTSEPEYRYEEVTITIGTTREAAAAHTESSESDDTTSGSTSSGGSTSATPRFEVVPAPAPSDGGAGSPLPDSADTADEAGVASARLFDFDIERQAIVDTSTGAIVGVYDEATGNFVSPTDDSLIAVIDPSNGEVTVLASGEVVARVLAAAGDDSAADDSGDSGSNTLVYVLIGAAALLLVLLGVYWLGARQRGGPPGGTGAAAAAASPTPAAPAAPVAHADTPPVTQQTPLPPPPPADPGAPPSPPAQ